MTTLKCSECQVKLNYHRIFNPEYSLPKDKLDENNLTKCSFCNIKLCPDHAKKAKYYGNYYRSKDCYMCDQCCWFEIG